MLVDDDPGEASATRIFGLQDRSGITDLVDASPADVSSRLVRVSSTLRVLPHGISQDPDTIDSDGGGDHGGARRPGRPRHGQRGVLHLSAGALAWAQAADSAILVAVRDQARRDDVEYAAESLRLVGVEVAGRCSQSASAGSGAVDPDPTCPSGRGRRHASREGSWSVRRHAISSPSGSVSRCVSRSASPRGSQLWRPTASRSGIRRPSRAISRSARCGASPSPFARSSSSPSRSGRSSPSRSARSSPSLNRSGRSIRARARAVRSVEPEPEPFRPIEPEPEPEPLRSVEPAPARKRSTRRAPRRRSDPSPNA